MGRCCHVPLIFPYVKIDLMEGLHGSSKKTRTKCTEHLALTCSNPNGGQHRAVIADLPQKILVAWLSLAAVCWDRNKHDQEQASRSGSGGSNATMSLQNSNERKHSQ